MKKSKKWILIASGIVLFLLTVAMIIFFILREAYLKKLPYDEIDPTAYNQVKIVSEDGAYYLEIDGERSDQAYTYLKSVNDFYESTSDQPVATRYLYEYYLAKKSGDSNYWLVLASGGEYRIEGDNLSLTDVSLPFLIFTSNTNSRMTAFSLRALDSQLSTIQDSNLILTQTFLYLEAERVDEEQDSYDYLLAKNDQEGKQSSVYSPMGAKLFDCGNLALVPFEKKVGAPSYYFVDTDSHAIYSSAGALLSASGELPTLSPDLSFAYRYCESDSALPEDSLFFFSADHSFSVSGRDYDLAKRRMFENCLVVERLHEHVTDVFIPATGEVKSYQSVTEREGVLVATDVGGTDFIYLSGQGKELLRSPYDDMKLHELTTENCFVFTSPAYNNALSGTYAYFFAVEGKGSAEKQLTLEETLQLPSDLCLTDCEVPVYLISQNDQDGTPLRRMYTPFAAQTESNVYHAIDFYCHGGTVWALGTSYTRETYDILDPASNVLTISIAAKNTDLARLSFEYCETASLLTDPYNEKSTVNTAILKLTRFEDKQSSAVATRYFALYRGEFSTSDAFGTTPLQVKELGQNLLLSHPYEFYPDNGTLVIHHLMGSSIYRFDEARHLFEAASVPYYVSDVLVDGTNASTLYYVLASVTGRNEVLSDSARFGVADSAGTILLPPIYSSILFADQNRFVVYQRQAYGVVEYRDEKLRTLVDFDYRGILPLSDEGYLALAADGTYELFQKGDRLERGILSYSFVEMIRTDEDGYLTYASAPLLNIDGTLYLHEPEHYESVTYTVTESPISHSSEIIDRRAKLISYYDATGALSASDLLIPTVTDQTYFEANHTGEWYTSPDAKEQDLPITQEIILGSEDHFFHLYPKAAAEAAQ